MKDSTTGTTITGRTSGEDLSAMDPGRLEFLDYRARMEHLHRYRRIERNQRLEEKALEKTIECKTFRTRLLPQVCMLRKQLFPYKPCLECNEFSKK